jgi:uncharacterized protein
MPNQLADETSPYLQQHQDNPVDWFPWNNTALLKARQENKPIFLSIGYSACHWCHVMAHESFENPQTAQLLNDHFISIKVDREERPDLDDIYMQAVVMLTGQGGWPLSVFLTPDLKPFFGGTYFPPHPRHRLPSFNQVLRSVIDTWLNQPESLEHNAQILTNAIKHEHHPTHSSPTMPNLDLIIKRLHTAYDWKTGGWGTAPKFPQPMLIEFLIQSALAGSPQANQMTVHILEKMSQGGMYDLIGGGFHRYSTDTNWLIPHFEKMLYDNAQLALAYLHAYALTRHPRLKHVVEKTLSFIQFEMTNPQGGFYSSIDADTEEGEGRYYAWDVEELKTLLSPDEFALLESATHLSLRGNFEHGLNVLQIQSDNFTSEDPGGIKLQSVFKKLKAVRDRRNAPGKDEKIITEWNGMAIRAFAEAGLLFNNPEYVDIARTGVRFITENLFSPEGKLYRTWRDGKASHPGTLADYASLILALHAVYLIDFDPQLFQQMRSFFKALQRDFASEGSLYDDASTGVIDLIVRPRALQDNATPSGNALAAYVHWLFGNYDHAPAHLDRAERMVRHAGSVIQDYPTSFGCWLQVSGLLQHKTQQVALITLEGLKSLQPFLDVYRHTYRPHVIIAVQHGQTSPDSIRPAVLEGRSTITDRPTAYVCQGFICLEPVTESSKFKDQLDQN